MKHDSDMQTLTQKHAKVYRKKKIGLNEVTYSIDTSTSATLMETMQYILA